jgi:hypothetical protein
VVRLAPVPPDGQPATGAAAILRLARVPRGDDGESRGWWWTVDGLPPSESTGWAWHQPPRHHANNGDLRQDFPTLRVLGDEYAMSLIRALPFDAQWYQIGVTPRGTPVWAWISTHDDYDTQISNERPEEDE